MEKIKILVVEPNKEPYTKLINNSINEIYGLVYYPYEQIQIEKDVFIMYSKEATEKQDQFLKQNRRINNTLLYGTFVIVKKKKDNFISLTLEQTDELKEFLANCKDVKFEF